MHIGYQRIPVTGMTRTGKMTVSVHITYVTLNNKIEIWEARLHPGIQNRLDQVDEASLLAHAKYTLLATVKPIIKERSWEGVMYG